MTHDILHLFLFFGLENFHFLFDGCALMSNKSRAAPKWGPVPSDISCFHSCITRWKAAINFKSLCLFNTHFCLQTRLIRQQLSAEMVSYRSGWNESMSRHTDGRRDRETERQRDREMWHLFSFSSWFSSSSSLLDESLDGNGEHPPPSQLQKKRKRKEKNEKKRKKKKKRRKSRKRRTDGMSGCAASSDIKFIYEKLSILSLHTWLGLRKWTWSIRNR